MKKAIDPKAFVAVCDALIHSDAKTATKFLDEKTVVHATWKFKPSGRNSREEIIVTFGAPNYLDRVFIKKYKKAGEPLPVKKIQLRAYPKKKIIKKAA
jgi:hypothetical protein